MIKNYTSITRGIVLAAGDGDRMGELTKNRPKVLLPLNSKGEPLIASPIRALAESGIRNIAIVVGYLGDEVIRNLGEGGSYDVKLDYVNNPNYLDGNAISVWKAKSWAKGEPIILCMGDHIIEPKGIQHLLSSELLIDTLCVEYRPTPLHDIEEATKVVLNKDGSIRDIGKGLGYWDALDTGVFLLTERFFIAVEELFHLQGNTIEISDVIRFMISRGIRFNTCDMSGCSWMDIDIEEDLKLARTKGVLNGRCL
jgi:choline kinase